MIFYAYCTLFWIGNDNKIKIGNGQKNRWCAMKTYSKPPRQLYIEHFKTKQEAEGREVELQTMFNRHRDFSIGTEVFYPHEDIFKFCRESERNEINATRCDMTRRDTTRQDMTRLTNIQIEKLKRVPKKHEERVSKIKYPKIV